jgi:chromate transporter
MMEMIDSLWNLFFSFLKVGSFSFGGAYSLIPLIEKEVVANHQWITNDEFLKVLGMVEIFPGAISIKFATYTGYKVAGIPGAIVANIGNLFTPALLIVLSSYFINYVENNAYFVKSFTAIKYAIAGMIVAVMFQYVFKNGVGYKEIIFLSAGIVMYAVFKLHPIVIIAISALLGILIL